MTDQPVEAARSVASLQTRSEAPALERRGLNDQKPDSAEGKPVR